jgi:hypothetical protein
MTDRDQEGKPGLGLLFDDRDGVLAFRVEAESRGNLSRNAFPAAMRSPTDGRGTVKLSSKAEGVWSPAGLIGIRLSLVWVMTSPF